MFLRLEERQNVLSVMEDINVGKENFNQLAFFRDTQRWLSQSTSSARQGF